MLKTLFSSKTRIKLLRTFLLHPEDEYFVRELTRLLDEQINGVRRELENFKKIGLVKYRTHNRKKHYFVNTDFFLYPELRSIFIKTLSDKNDLVGTITALGNIDLLILSGSFTKRSSTQVDMLLVGDVDKESIIEIMDNFSKEGEIKYSLMNTENFLYRLEFNDSFILSILKDPQNKIVVNKLKKFLKNS